MGGKQNIVVTNGGRDLVVVTDENLVALRNRLVDLYNEYVEGTSNVHELAKRYGIHIDAMVHFLNVGERHRKKDLLTDLDKLK